MATIGYARVSTRDQNPDGQTDALEAAGCDKIFVEHASGTLAKRPALTDALGYLREGDSLVVTKLDRLGRSVRNLKQVADELQQRVRKVRHEAEAVIRLMKGLEQVRILGEVESSRLRGADLGLSAVMAQMQEFHTRVRDGIAPMISLLRQFETAS